MALEALELINIEFVCGNGSHHKKEDRHKWDEDCPITNRWRKAITAIKEALAQPEQEPVRIMGFDCVCGRRMTVSAEQGVVPAPQRKPLTEKRIEELYSFWVVDCQDIVGFARAVERTVKGEV